jgi:hypothetical protein
MPGFSPELIRIRPRRIRVWRLDPQRTVYVKDARSA